MRSILFIGAHPDDETFFAAGTFARYSAAGAHVAVVCATRGQLGKTSDLCSREDLARVREAELNSAMGAVGVTDITVLDFQDKQLNEAPVDEIRRQLVNAIRRTRPDVIMTFDPMGGNNHPDHIAISRFTSDAISIAADSRWFPEAGPAHSVARLLWTPPVFIYKLPVERAIQEEPGFDFIINVVEFIPEKTAAFRAHRTQFTGLKKLFFDDPNGKRTFHLEAFRFAAGIPPSRVPSDDLFDGVPENVSSGHLQFY